MPEVAKQMNRNYEATKKLRRRALFEFTERFQRLRGREDD